MLEEHIPLSNPENYPIYVLNEFPGELFNFTTKNSDIDSIFNVILRLGWQYLEFENALVQPYEFQSWYSWGWSAINSRNESLFCDLEYLFHSFHQTTWKKFYFFPAKDWFQSFFIKIDFVKFILKSIKARTKFNPSWFNGPI